MYLLRTVWRNLGFNFLRLLIHTTICNTRILKLVKYVLNIMDSIEYRLISILISFYIVLKNIIFIDSATKMFLNIKIRRN